MPITAQFVRLYAKRKLCGGRIVGLSEIAIQAGQVRRATMLQMILVALVQAAAGDVAPPSPILEPPAPSAREESVVVSPAPPEERRVNCRRESQTGSTLVRRTCRTERLTEAEGDHARRALRRATQPRLRTDSNGNVIPF